MREEKRKSKFLMLAILSLSLLTVMAGAAVAPALGVVKAYFSDTNPLFIQMVVSMPAIFIVFTNFLFPKLCRYMGSKTLVMLGLILYTFGGCSAGSFSNIFLVLAARALVGFGVGIIMPLSTGLLSYYFAPEEQEKLMGYSSAMNQMGGVVATLLSGLLAVISWRASFLVYLLGLISMIACFFFLPNDRIKNEDSEGTKTNVGKVFYHNASFVVGMFLLMVTFYIYPTNFAIEVASEGVIPQQYVAIIMAFMDFVAFLGGLFFVKVKILFQKKTRFVAPILFLIGYLLMTLVGGWIGNLTGSVFIGFANGMGIPYIISTASKKAGLSAVTTVIPLISAALYLAQFLTPMIVSFVTSLVGSGVLHLPYWTAIVCAICFLLWSHRIKDEEPMG